MSLRGRNRNKSSILHVAIEQYLSGLEVFASSDLISSSPYIMIEKGRLHHTVAIDRSGPSDLFDTES